MNVVENPFRGGQQKIDLPDEVPFPSVDAARAEALVARCPHAGVTPLLNAETLAQVSGVGEVWIKDERARMGLGSFKALGAAYVIASDADAGVTMSGRTYVTASAGNHGLSVAAGAQAFGAQAVIYLAETVPKAFAQRLRDLGADVVRAGAIYEDSMAAAALAADANGWVLLSDSSWPGYFTAPHTLMEGYLIFMAEVFEQIPQQPTHLFLQAGVGGLAGAAAAIARDKWGEALRIVVVEPKAAPALAASIEAGKSVVADGPVSAMGRLDCKEPSLIALKGLARDADQFVTISEKQAADGISVLADHGLKTTPSGGAGLAAMLIDDDKLGLNVESRVLAILSEGPE